MPFSSKHWSVAAATLVLAGTLALSCERSTSPTPPNPGGPRFNHVFILVEENTGYSSVIGGSSMPYLNGLGQQYGLATQY